MAQYIEWKGQKLDIKEIDPELLYLIECLLFSKINPIHDRNAHAKEKALLRVMLFGEEDAESYLNRHLSN